MWWETNAQRPLATQKVLFSSPPQASTGRRRSKGSGSGCGTWPRERRTGTSRPASTRVTESSVRTWIGRSWVRKASAIPPSRRRASPSSYAIGSSETFPLVSTNGRPRPSARRWWSGV